MKRRISRVLCILSAAVFCLSGCAAVSIDAEHPEEGVRVEVVSSDPEHPVNLTVTVDGQELAALKTEDGTEGSALLDGTYLARFDTDSSMFHASEAVSGRGTLTVEDGKMRIHVPLQSKKILNLFPGTAEDARKEGAELLQPVEEEVTYPDGLTEEVYAFDIPVPQLDEPFALALVGTKGKWYDHMVTVSDPQPAE